MTHTNISPATPTGWVCPCCRAVMAPHYPTCFYCKPQSPGLGIPTGPATTGTPPIWGSPYVSKISGGVLVGDDGTRVQNGAKDRRAYVPSAFGAPYGLGSQKPETGEPK